MNKRDAKGKGKEAVPLPEPPLQDQEPPPWVDELRGEISSLKQELITTQALLRQRAPAA